MEYSKEERMKMVSDVVKQTRKYAHRLQPQDIISIGCVSIVLPIGFFLELFYVLPFWFETFSPGWYKRVGVLAFLAINFYLNLLKLIRVGPNGAAAPLPTVMKSGFRYCHSCRLNSPPRAYHCPVCDVCVFRRDHHCSFGATCVGHFNQRYFVAGVANLWLAFAIAACWNWSFVWTIAPRVNGIQFWQLMMPHVALIAGFLTLGQFLSIFFFVSTLSAFLFVTYLAAAQIFCIFRGQTRVEYLLNIFAYNNGLMENIRQSLGTRWPLTFISPFFPSPLPSDGISFKAFDGTDISKETKFL